MNVVIAAGGTGGHLYPAVALARELLRQVPGSAVTFVGTSRGIESKVLPKEGFELELIDAKPVMGRGIVEALAAFATLPLGLWQSLRLLRRRGAELVIGIGGYASPPVLLAAWLLRIKRAILEPNAYPGMANKVIGPLANLVFVGHAAAAGAFPPAAVRLTGTPVRREFSEAGGPSDAGGPRDRTTLLIFGGSQGAHAINVAVMEALPFLSGLRDRLRIVHQTGAADVESVRSAYAHAGLTAEVSAFIYDMPRALREADAVLSRAGAVTLAELTVSGKPAVLVPLPSAIYNHQEKNARVLEEAGAAVVLLQRDLTGARLAEAVTALLADPGRLNAMGQRSRQLGRADAAEAVVRECRTLVEGRDETNQSSGATGA